MRDLAEPEVLKKSIAAAAVSAVACLPRLHAWETRKYPVWYLESVLFLGAIVFWAFVFAWHSKYSGRPLFTLRPDRVAFGIRDRDRRDWRGHTVLFSRSNVKGTFTGRLSKRPRQVARNASFRPDVRGPVRGLRAV